MENLSDLEKGALPFKGFLVPKFILFNNPV
jgi:hypothetical protein